MKNNKKVVAVVVTAVAITGSASALANASSARAKSGVKTTKTSVTTVTRTFNVNGMGAMAGNMPGGMHGRGGDITNVLSDLVNKGTITADESKAVTDAWSALELAKRTSNVAPTPRTPGAFGGPMGGFQNSNKDAIITSTLGIDSTTLHNRLAAGESLASIAGANKDKLIAALVADESKQIDAAVSAGKLTAAQATTLKANLTAHITAEVNETHPAGAMPGNPDFRGPGRGHGHGMMGGPNGATNGIPAPGQSKN